MNNCACPSSDATECIRIRYMADRDDPDDLEECQCSCHDDRDENGEDWIDHAMREGSDA